ncbi:MAG: LysR family transcriptional regulator [Alphaproteobacteria bacterium]|nr:LysR family transcriptional regulator [Alphaproteobacteria bacterium]
MALVDRLPPLSALRAFEAAARHLHFTRAAEELGMTQAAVSYQIKLLEERIGAPLFLRQPRQLALTETGERMAPGIIESFALMRSTFAASQARAEALLAISTTQTFATEWLAPRIGGFQIEHPDIAVKFDIDTRLVDFSRDAVDVAIRAGKGNWPGLDAHLLIRADFTPMLSPRAARQVREPADLLDLTLIDRNDVWWSIWFEAAGVSFDGAGKESGLRLDSQALAASVARSGQGVAILTPAFYVGDLAHGSLVQPFPLVCTRGYGYYLVYPHGRRNAPHIRAFRNWILAQAPPVPPMTSAGIVTPMDGRAEGG